MKTTMDKDRIILVVYFNVRGIPDFDIYSAQNKIYKSLEHFDDSIIKMVVPIREGETHVECINPQLVTEEKYKEAEEAVEKLKKMLEEKK